MRNALLALTMLAGCTAAGEIDQRAASALFAPSPPEQRIIVEHRGIPEPVRAPAWTPVGPVNPAPNVMVGSPVAYGDNLMQGQVRACCTEW